MERSKSRMRTGVFSLVVLAVLAAQGLAAPVKDSFVGSWEVKVDFNGREMTSILALSKDKEGRLSGQWISFRGVSELDQVKQDGTKLGFTLTRRFRESESTLSFAGEIEGRTLSGTLSSDRGQSKVEGRRIRVIPRAVGTWQATIRGGGEEHAATLIITTGKKGRLSARCETQWGAHRISDVAFKNGKLTFKLNSTVEGRQWESAFEGTVKRHELAATVTGEGGEFSITGKRVGAALIGTWDLKVTSDSGNRAQILKVDPDLSGWYGSVALDAVALEGNRVSFATTLEFGDEKSDLSFSGTLDGKKLTGELTSPRGTRTVEGFKRGGRQALKPSRKPDVVFVPTPPEVVEKMLELANVKQDDLVYDLGCGDGRIVVTAAQKYGCTCIGYDISPRRVRESRENVEAKGVGDLVRIEQKDIFTLDLREANVITLYLLPSLNVKLIPQLEKLKPGSRIVSHDFAMQGVKPDKIITVTPEDSHQKHTVYLWTTPLKKEGGADG